MKEFLSLILIISLIIIGTKFTEALPTNSKDPFNVRPKRFPQNSLGIKYLNESSKLGIDVKNYKNYYSFDSSYIAIADYDNDGLEDILWIYSSYLLENPTQFRLLKNIKGKYFEDVSEEVGLKEILKNDNKLENISAVGFVDLDNDGFEDIYVGRIDKPHYVLKNVKGKFQLWKNFLTQTIEYQNTKGLNFFDFDKNGYIDILITNFIDNYKVYGEAGWGQDIILKTLTPVGVRPFSQINSNDGQKPILLQNINGSQLVNKSHESGLNDTRATWASGIGDFQNNGSEGIFFANDFGFDSFYRRENKNSEVLFKKNRDTLFRLRSRFSMGAEVGDIANNGKLAIFASNASKPGFTKGFQSLWVNQAQSGKEIDFEDKAESLGLDKCGFSWGGRFADLNKDGLLDLVVVNGRNGKQTTRGWIGAIWLNYVVPISFRQHFPLAFSLGDEMPVDWAGGQKNCVFMQTEKGFQDVAEQIGIVDEYNGRGISYIDFNNDGQEDILISNVGATPTFYIGERNNENNWLGLKLVGTKSNRDAIGSKVYLNTKKLRQMRTIHPGNGFSSENTKRLLFGINKDDEFNNLEIIWPSGRKQKITNLKINSYQTIYEE